MICAYCQDPNADLFSPNGNAICQGCDTRFRASIVEHRGAVAASNDPTASLMFASPGKLLAVGGGMVGLAIVLGVLEIFFIGRVHIWLIGFLLFGGIITVFRGVVR